MPAKKDKLYHFNRFFPEREIRSEIRSQSTLLFGLTIFGFSPNYFTIRINNLWLQPYTAATRPRVPVQKPAERCWTELSPPPFCPTPPKPGTFCLIRLAQPEDYPRSRGDPTQNYHAAFPRQPLHIQAPHTPNRYKIHKVQGVKIIRKGWLSRRTST